jgi:hypothetical protein
MTKEQQAEQEQPQVNAADVVVEVSSAVSSEASDVVSSVAPWAVPPVAAEVMVPSTVITPRVARPKAQSKAQPKAQAAIQQPAIQPEPVSEAPVEAPPVSAVQQQEEAVITVEVEASRPATPPLPDPRRRLRELLAIPDRERTDALWDELIELEIQLAPGNRALPPGTEPGRSPKQPARFANPGRRPESSGAPRHNNRPHGNAPGGNGASHGAPQGAAPGTPGAPRPAKRFFKKARRGPRPPG